MLIAFNKPYGVLTQFTADDPPHRTLADFGFPPKVYPLGRLDADSEGLLLLSDEPALNEKLLHPRFQHRRRYWAQVERQPATDALRRLEQGVLIQGRRTLPCRAWKLESEPPLTPRIPPVRFRKNVPTAWLAIELIEGKNRQVRRMTAAIGHPTLRLIRAAIGEFEIGSLQPGEWRRISDEERRKVFAANAISSRANRSLK